MTTAQSILDELERKGSEKTRNTLARHGVTGNVFGVSIADLKTIAKTIKGQQQLALELYDTGNHDAMYLAGIVADGSQMTKKQLEQWAKAAPNAQIAEYTVPGVAVESHHANSLAAKWITSKQERIAACGWCTYSGIVAVTPDADLDEADLDRLLDLVESSIHSSANRVRYTMNGFVISVGSYVPGLLQAAKDTARTLGAISVDVGQTACKVPDALSYIAKIENMGRIGKKRKTFKC